MAGDGVTSKWLTFLSRSSTQHSPGTLRVASLGSHHPLASPALPAGPAPVQTLSGTILPVPCGCHGCQADRHAAATLSVKLVLWSEPGWTCWLEEAVTRILSFRKVCLMAVQLFSWLSISVPRRLQLGSSAPTPRGSVTRGH